MRRQSRSARPERPDELREAAAILRTRADALEATLPPFDLALTIASLGVITELSGEGIAGVRSAIESILAPAAKLFAADQIHAALIGEGAFSVPAGAPVPIRGQVLIKSLLQSLPANIRPDGFNHEAIFQAARTISQPIISDIKEGEFH